MKEKIKNFIIFLLKVIYELNIATYFSLLFLMFYGVNLNFQDCLEKAHLFKIFFNLELFFMYIAIVLIAVNMIFASIIADNPFIIKDENVPSRVGEFKDFYILFPFILMIVIGFFKTFFIFLPCNKVYYEDKNKIFVIFMFVIAIFSNYLFNIGKNLFNKITRNIKIKINFFIFNSTLLSILLIVFYYENNFVFFNDNLIYLIMYAILFYIGITNFIHILFKLKKEKKITNFKFCSVENIKKLFLYLSLFIIFILINCFPEIVKKFLYNLYEFFKCVINH